MKRLIIQASIVALLVASLPAIAQAQSDTRQSGSGQLEPASPAPKPEEGGASTAAAAPLYCYGTRGDYVHLSSGQASGHGWRVNHSLPAGTIANVDVKLQVNFHGYLFLNWVDVTGWSSKDVYPGGGSGRRATARYTCRGNAWVQWRSVVDVDILGYSDPANKLYTTPQWLRCSL